MAVAFDSSSKGYTNTDDSSALTVAHTCSGSNRALLVGAVLETASSPSVTYNSVAMSLLDSQSIGAGTYTMYYYYLLAPATGTNNIVVSKTNSLGAIIGLSFTGVSSTPFGTVDKSGASGTAVSDTVSTTADDMGVDFMFTDNPSTQTEGAGQTKVVGDLPFGPGLLLASYGLDDDVMSWTLNPSANYAHIAAPLLSGTQASATVRGLSSLGAGV